MRKWKTLWQYLLIAMNRDAGSDKRQIIFVLHRLFAIFLY